MAISAKVAQRITSELRKYQPILADAKRRDVSESDIVVVIGDMLCDVFGYKKYQDITTEFAIRNSFVDLAVRVENEVRFLIEAKAIGIELKDTHVKQAIDYGVNQGIEWVVLTNGSVWRAYKIHFSQPVDKTLVFEIDVLACNPRAQEVVECFGSLSKEGFSRSAMDDLYQEKQVTSRFFIANVLLSEPMLDELRKTLRRLSPGLKVDTEFLAQVISNDVLKRELIDSDDGKAAATTLKKLQRGSERERERKKQANEPAESHGGENKDGA